MTTSSSRIALLKELIALETERSKINERVARLQNRLYETTEIVFSAPTDAKAVRPPAPASNGQRRGGVRDRVLTAVAAGGQDGVTVQELAALLKIKPANLHSWFSLNLDKTDGLRRIGEARYALDATGGKGVAKAGKKRAPKAKASKAPKAPKAPKAASKRGRSKASVDHIPSRRGELKAKVLAELKKAGSAGLTIKDLSEMTGARYKNLYIWFVTTGKRIEGIEKVGPARYRLA